MGLMDLGLWSGASPDRIFMMTTVVLVGFCYRYYFP